jgi:uncharacterized membrane protein YhaH (DUF805 family)
MKLQHGASASLGGIMGRFLSFAGRSSRSEWWAINVLFLVPLGILGKILLKDPNIGGLALAIMLCASIALLWVSIAASVRRLHDRNKNGSWYLFSLVPIVGPIWLFVQCGFLRGTPESNDFGQRAPSPFDLPR